MFQQFWVRLCVFGVAAMTSWPLSANPDAGRVIVVIVPPARQPSPPPPPSFPLQPPLQWAPPPALGLTPGRRSPTALCYAGTYVCPLTQPEQVGEPCLCGPPSDLLQGRALIPPSREISERQFPND